MTNGLAASQQELSSTGAGEAPAASTTAVGATPPAPQLTVAPRIVGIDLSLTATGIASRDYATVITSTPTTEVTWDNRDSRLRSIRNRVIQAVDQAQLVVIEGPSYGSKGGSTFDRAGLWWLLYRALRHRDIPVAVVSPKSRAKYATGTGNASKDAVLTAAARRLPTLHVESNNAADAAWLMAMGYDHYGHAIARVPESHRAALTAVDWPELVGQVT